MNQQNKTKRQKLRDMRTLAEYNDFLSGYKLKDSQRELLDMVFVRGWDYNRIADELGYSEAAIKNRMKKIYDLL